MRTSVCALLVVTALGALDACALSADLDQYKGTTSGGAPASGGSSGAAIGGGWPGTGSGASSGGTAGTGAFASGGNAGEAMSGGSAGEVASGGSAGIAQAGTTGSCTFASHPGLESGLVGYWALDETSGDTAFDRLDANNGWFTGTTTTSGRVGSARAFNGTTDYIALGASPSLSLANTAFTISAWINSASGQNDDAQVISRIVDNGWGIHIDRDPPGWPTGQYVELYFWGKDLAFIPQTFNSGEWYHLVGVFDGQYRIFYVNGAAIGAPFHASPLGSGNTAPTCIGNYGATQNTTYQFKGVIDEVGIWNRALSPSEVVDLYNAGNGTTCSPT